MYDKLMGHFSSPWMQLVVAVAVGFVVGLIAAAILKVVATRSKRVVIKSSAARIRSFVFVICIVFGLKVGLNAFDIQASTLAQIQGILTVLTFVLITWAVNHIYDSVHEALIAPWGDRNDNSTLTQVGATLAHILIWALGIISGLNSAGYNVTTVLAGLGIGGLAFALAAQDAVANIFGGIVVLTQSPFRVGDKIEINGIQGWVSSIGIRSTVIDTWKGYKVTLPNKVFTSSPVTNIDTRTEYWENMQLKLRHDCSIEQIERAQKFIREIVAKNEHIFDKMWVGVCNIGEGFVEIEVWYGILVWKPAEKDEYFNFYAKQLGVKNDFHISLLRALEKAKIPLATPIQGRILYENMAASNSRF